MTTLRQERQLETRETILQAAQQLFTRQGLHDVTMDEIADEAGVSRATVFNHFGSKALIIDAIASQILSNYLSILTKIQDEEKPASEQLLELAANIGRGVSANREFYSAMFGEMIRASVGFHEDGASHLVRRELDDKLLHLFLRGQVQGEFSSLYKAQEMVTAFDNQIFGSISHWLQQHKPPALETALKRSCVIMLSGIAAD